jgi:two-component system, NtrC family, response regulator AtoC
MGDIRGTALLVDDDVAVGKVLSALLAQIGVRSVRAQSGEEALSVLERQSVDLIISDVCMPSMDGLTLLGRVTQNWPDIPVILLTAHGSVPLAVQAMKAGACEFLLKPFERDEVIFVVEKALATSTLADQLALQPSGDDMSLLGESAAMRGVRELIRRAASGIATVLIHGETGTGKELVARAIHQSSPRRDAPFVKLNSAAIPENLLESELFGYEKGAFTGALARKPGRVELAQSGTLFLDEIGDVPLSTQVKLLRVLQEREIERLGGTQSIKVDVRFVAATHRNLSALIEKGQFREDLFYRLNVIPIDVPPLRERPEDIVPLAIHFAKSVGRTNGRLDAHLEPGVIDLFKSLPWPGNVRQLENFVERLVVLSDSGHVTRTQAEAELSREAERQRPARSNAPVGGSAKLEDERRDAERQAIERALSRAGNNRSLAARLLGISRRTLYNKMEEMGIA